jgi:hypothetical protein
VRRCFWVGPVLVGSVLTTLVGGVSNAAPAPPPPMPSGSYQPAPLVPSPSSKARVEPDDSDRIGRKMLNLPIDDSSIRKGLAQSAARIALLGRDPAPFAMSDAEQSLLDAQQQANDLIVRMRESGEWGKLGIAYAYVSTDIQNPKLVLRMVSNADRSFVPGLEGRLRGLLGDRLAKTEIVDVGLPNDQFVAAEQVLLSEKTQSAIGAALKSPVSVVIADYASQVITLLLLPGGNADSVVMNPASKALASNEVLKATGLSLTVKLDIGQTPTPADTYQHPGPRQSGEIDYCSLGYGLRIYTKVLMTTAAHCHTNGSVVSHQNAQIGVVNESVFGAGSDYANITMTGASTINLNNGFTVDRVDSLASPNAMSRGLGVETVNTMTDAYLSLQPSAGSTLCIYGSSAERRPGTTFDASAPSIASVPTQDRSCGVMGSANFGGFGFVPQLSNYVCSGDSGGLVASPNNRVFGGVQGFVSTPQPGFPLQYPIKYRYSAGVLGAVCAQGLTVSYVQRNVSAGGGRSVLLGTADTLSQPRPATFGTLRNPLLAPGNIQECISAVASGTANGTAYHQWGCIPNTNAQSFGFQPITQFNSGYSTDFYRIVRPNGNAPICLGIDRNYNGGYGNYVPVTGWGCLASLDAAQIWRVEWNPSSANGQGGWMRLRNWWNGGCLSVRMDEGGLQDANLHMFGCFEGNAAQQWLIGPGA